jgi:signal transduction histidine kinase
MSPGENDTFRRLSGELAAWFAAARPALEWNARQRQANAREFIQEEVLPRRVTAVGLADRIQEVSEKQLEASSESVSEMFSSFRSKLMTMLILTVVIGAVLAGATLWRLLRLEHESDRRFEEILKARREMEQLSAQVVSAQEDERRRISRELHDEVGQVLSAMVLALGNLRSSIATNNMDEASRQMQLLQNMVEQNVSVVRNIALLLRPTMLDDLGLIPALRWLARETSRTSAVQVDLLADDCPESLPEEHRTCVFRVVQESVRNACRHSGATLVRIHVGMKGHTLRVWVQDDGKGFDPARETGLGILGMEERVARLGGTLRIDSERGLGATVEFALPLSDILESAGPAQPTAEAESPQEIRPFRTA